MRTSQSILSAVFGMLGGLAVAVVGIGWAARDGSGTYTLPSGNPVVSGTQISSTWANNTLTDIASALTESISKTGVTTPTANLPMGGFRHTGVGTASARNHYGVVSQVQDSAYNVVQSVTGTDTITGSLSPTISAYADGMSATLIPAATNTGAVTLALNGLTARSVVKNNGAALVAGDLVLGVPATVVYDLTNTRWSLVNPQITAVAAGGTGGATAAAARTNLGLAIGTDVQAFDAELGEIAALSDADGNFIVGNGTAWVAESGATARTSLGLGTLATPSPAATDGNFVVGNGTTFVAESGATARTSLGVAIGSDVQAWDANLDQVAALAVTDGNFIVGNGSAWVAESGATALASIGAAATSHSHATSDVTSGTFANARIAQGNVTQHEAAINHDALTNFVANEHRLITVSTSAPSGGSNGDVWLRYTP